MRSNMNVMGRLLGSLVIAVLFGAAAYYLWPTGIVSESASSDTVMGVVRAVLSVGAGIACVAALLSTGSAAD